MQALHLKQGRGLSMDIIQSSTTMNIIPVSGYNKSDYQNTVAKRVQFHKFENSKIRGITKVLMKVLVARKVDSCKLQNYFRNVLV